MTTWSNGFVSYMVIWPILLHNKYIFDTIRLADLGRGTFSNETRVGIRAPYAVGKPAPSPYWNFDTTSMSSGVIYLQNKRIVT